MHTDTTTSLRGEVRAEMARQGITRQTLADRTDISVWAIGRALSGQRDFSLTEVLSIAAALGLPASELVARAERAA